MARSSSTVGSDPGCLNVRSLASASMYNDCAVPSSASPVAAFERVRREAVVKTANRLSVRDGIRIVLSMVLSDEGAARLSEVGGLFLQNNRV